MKLLVTPKNELSADDLAELSGDAKGVPKWCPILSKDQKQNRVKFCKNMLEKIIDDPDILRQIIAGDETWVFKYDHETKRQSIQWKTAEPPRPKKACDTRTKL